MQHVGGKTVREMAESGQFPFEAFHRAAIKAARAAGLSEEDIAAIYGEPLTPAFDGAAADTARAQGISDEQIERIFGYVPPPPPLRT